MKLRINLTLILALAGIISVFGQNLKVVDQSIKPTLNTEGHSPKWPTLDSDGNRNPQQALIIIKYDGYPEEELPHLKINPDISNLNDIKNLKDANGQPITFIYVPIENNDLNISSPYGPTNVRLNQLANKGIYEMTLLVDKKMDINIEPLTDYESIKVYIDGALQKDTPAHYSNVSLGKHRLKFEFPDGSSVTRDIIVTVNTERFNEITNPDLDLRQRIPAKIESTSKNATLYIDDVAVATSLPHTAYLPSGDHTFKVVNNNNEREFDVMTAKVDRENPEGISLKFHPRERRKFVVSASYQGVDNVPMMLYAGKEEAYKITEDHAKGERRSYVFDLPIGTKYKFKATYQGNEGKRTIKVTHDMDTYQNITIKKRRKIVWPWEREYAAPPVGLTAAYVQKQYHVKSGGETIYKGTLTAWDEEGGGWLHGIKAGVQYQPTFGFGLGLYTGLFYEYYLSKTHEFDVAGTDMTTYFSKYQEHSLSLPVEVFYNFPFAKKIALAIHGGIQGNLMLARSYSGLVDNIDGIKFEDSYNALKDKDGFFPELPGMFSLYWEVGAQLRLGPVMLGAQLTRPITSHKWEFQGTEFTTTSIKNSFSLTYVF